MKLELKHLAPYLPYGLKLKGKYTGINWSMIGFNKHMIMVDSGNYVGCDSVKPILRPKSDFNKYIKALDGNEFLPELEIFKCTGVDTCIFDIMDGFELCIDPPVDSIYIFLTFDQYYGVCQKLFEWHFDVFNLIKKDLAIDFNSIK